jgi:hypothetical protein
MAQQNSINAIGFRAETQHVYWAVVTGEKEQPKLIDSGKISPPKIFSEPEKLTWYNNRVLQLTEQHNIVACYVRTAEPSAKTKSILIQERSRIEGVIIQALETKKLRISIGPLATLSSKIGTKSAKDFIDGAQFRALDWEKIKNKSQREAILSAVSVLEM